jgi:hypothetical protein
LATKNPPHGTEIERQAGNNREQASTLEPWRRLPFWQSALREGSIFARNDLTESVNDARFSKVVGRHLKLDSISSRQADESFPHFSRDVGEDEMLIGKLNAKHSSREHSDDFTFGDNRTFHRHRKLEAFGYWLRDFIYRIAAFDQAANRLAISST